MMIVVKELHIPKRSGFRISQKVRKLEKAGTAELNPRYTYPFPVYIVYNIVYK